MLPYASKRLQWQLQLQAVLFVELQDLRRERDMLDVEWGQLQLEQGALTTHGQVEQAARGRLDMVSPAPEDIMIVDP